MPPGAGCGRVWSTVIGGANASPSSRLGTGCKRDQAGPAEVHRTDCIDAGGTPWQENDYTKYPANARDLAGRLFRTLPADHGNHPPPINLMAGIYTELRGAILPVNKWYKKN